jgi:hypothetical protein
MIRNRIFDLLGGALLLAAGAASAHHSFAVYDMTQSIEFEGVVKSVKFRNPHMSLTLVQTKPDGTKETINFVEGAPANMIARMGLRPADVAPGQTIKAIGAPRRDDPTAYFLKTIILQDGRHFASINSP